MSDIFHEVEEEVRRDRYEQLWKQYGDYVVAALALVVIAVAGWQLYQRYEDNQRLKASETLITAQQLATAGDASSANQALGAVVKSAPNGYAEMARLTEAGVLLTQGKRDEAVTIYKSIAADDHGQIGSVALIRAGWALADFAKKPELESLLKPLTAPGNPWRSAAMEILAYADYRAGMLETARSEFEVISKDTEAPEALRRRAEIMAGFIKSGGMPNYGTVPVPVPTSPPAVPAAPAAPTGSPK